MAANPAMASRCELVTSDVARRLSLRGEAEVLPGDHDAGGKALEVPFPGAGERLVEVVVVEHEPTFRRRVGTEVGQVGVTTELDIEVGGGRRGEVGGHDPGQNPIERERGHLHPGVADRHEPRGRGRRPAPRARPPGRGARGRGASRPWVDHGTDLRLYRCPASVRSATVSCVISCPPTSFGDFRSVPRQWGASRGIDHAAPCRTLTSMIRDSRIVVVGRTGVIADADPTRMAVHRDHPSPGRSH